MSDKLFEDQVVVITGSGRAFCAGADLGDLKKSYKEGVAPSLGKELNTYFNPLIRQIRKMEKPVIGAVNGLAAGAGATSWYLLAGIDVQVAIVGQVVTS
ncbi:MAG: enoyl-CoA hydratase/isomerase family protein [Candidatus Hydrogenedentes bacterium]|nr:enoyl-CoA hydratase/isomerase family protein [Candidatus Hydrogenedentota bacterium]